MKHKLLTISFVVILMLTTAATTFAYRGGYYHLLKNGQTNQTECMDGQLPSVAMIDNVLVATCP